MLIIQEQYVQFELGKKSNETLNIKNCHHQSITFATLTTAPTLFKLGSSRVTLAPQQEFRLQIEIIANNNIMLESYFHNKVVISGDKFRQQRNIIIKSDKLESDNLGSQQVVQFYKNFQDFTKQDKQNIYKYSQSLGIIKKHKYNGNCLQIWYSGAHKQMNPQVVQFENMILSINNKQIKKNPEQSKQKEICKVVLQKTFETPIEGRIIDFNKHTYNLLLLSTSSISVFNILTKKTYIQHRLKDYIYSCILPSPNLCLIIDFDLIYIYSLEKTYAFKVKGMEPKCFIYLNGLLGFAGRNLSRLPLKSKTNRRQILFVDIQKIYTLQEQSIESQSKFRLQNNQQQICSMTNLLPYILINQVTELIMYNFKTKQILIKIESVLTNITNLDGRGNKNHVSILGKSNGMLIKAGFDHIGSIWGCEIEQVGKIGNDNFQPGRKAIHAGPSYKQNGMVVHNGIENKLICSWNIGLDQTQLTDLQFQMNILILRNSKYAFSKYNQNAPSNQMNRQLTNLKDHRWLFYDQKHQASKKTHLSNAEELIHRAPIIYSSQRVVQCRVRISNQGGKGNQKIQSGHPLQYIQLITKKMQPVSCKYCGLKYSYKQQH